jgi:hypothetical protein
MNYSNEMLYVFIISNKSIVFQGFKTFKGLEICLIITIGVRCDQNELLNQLINGLLVEMIQKFHKDDSRHRYSHHHNHKPHALPDLNTFKLCMTRVFHSEFAQFFLSPTLVHFWSVDLRQLKLNIVKYLIYTYSVPYANRMSDLTSLSDERNIGKYGRFNTNMLTSSSAPIFIFFKSIQNFVYQSFIKFVLNNNLTELLKESSSLQYELEELTVNTFLKAVVSLDPSLAKFNSDSIFEILWTTLIKLRENLFEKSRIPDPFIASSSVTPSFLLRMGGYFSLNQPYDCREANSLDELRTSFENSMRAYFKAVVGDEVVPKSEEEETKEIEASVMPPPPPPVVASNPEDNPTPLASDSALNLQSVSTNDIPRAIKDLKKPTASKISNIGSSVNMNEV